MLEWLARESTQRVLKALGTVPSAEHEGRHHRAQAAPVALTLN